MMLNVIRIGFVVYGRKLERCDVAGGETDCYERSVWVDCEGEEVVGERESADGVEHLFYRVLDAVCCRLED